MNALVIAVSRSAKHTLVKTNQDSIRLLTGLGVVYRGVCVNTLGSGHGADGLKGLARPLASVPCTRVGRRGRAKVHFRPTPDGPSVEAFFVSTMVVGLAEIGDKTQILSLMLAARFRRPLPIIFGILFATLANHAAAGLAGQRPGVADRQG